MRPSPALPFRLPATLATLAALAAASLSPASAAEPTEPSTTWSLGLGMANRQKPYTGIDRETQVLPLLHFENRYVRLLGPELGIKLPEITLSPSQHLDFSLVAKYDGSGYKDDDADILEGMRERKSGFWAGAKVEWRNPLAEVSAEWLADASGNSEGRRFSLAVEKSWRVSERLTLTPRLRANWQDENYADYYFGVRPSEARAGRPAYTAKAGINTELGLRSLYQLDKRHALMLDLEVTSLSKEIRDSPLVDRSTENRVFFGYLYRFR